MFIQRMNIAFNAGDYDAMFEWVDPEAEFVDHLPTEEGPRLSDPRY
jgi:hypothetical protein